jgi:hypothetical protein
LGFVGRFVVRVRVGQTTYQGEGGPLLDDNGPHRLDVQVRDDGVDLMRGRASYEMRAALPETRPVLGR